MKSPSVQLDPLNSPFPVPWNWVLATQSEGNHTTAPSIHYYRSPALISPDGQYAAYSRIQMKVQPQFTQSWVSSMLFLENLKTGDLQSIAAESPFADNPFSANARGINPGSIAILIPIGWSSNGDRILAREFESIFGTDIASDFAVVWDRSANRVRTLSPSGIQYTNAILMGWSQQNPDRVLFRAGNIGEEEWQLWSVDVSGQTNAAREDAPTTFGKVVNHVWAGPQAYSRR